MSKVFLVFWIDFPSETEFHVVVADNPREAVEMSVDDEARSGNVLAVMSPDYPFQRYPYKVMEVDLTVKGVLAEANCCC